MLEYYLITYKTQPDTYEPGNVPESHEKSENIMTFKYFVDLTLLFTGSHFFNRFLSANTFHFYGNFYYER